MKRKTYKKPRRKNRNRAVRRKFKSRRERVPRTARQYFSRSRKFQETWDSVAHVISMMRTESVSLQKASKEFGIDPRVVLKLGRSAVRKRKNGKYIARKTDRLLRILSMLTREGRHEIRFGTHVRPACSGGIGLRSSDISKPATILLCVNFRARRSPMLHGSAILLSPISIN
jgi:hypothetical protein